MLTQSELAVLSAIDASEYGDSLTDAVWTFTIADHSGLKPRSIPGVIASLNKKGLTTSIDDGKDSCIQMTRAGVRAYLAAVGSAARKLVPCNGHPAGPFNAMGSTAYCDGSCNK